MSYGIYIEFFASLSAPITSTLFFSPVNFCTVGSC